MEMSDRIQLIIKSHNLTASSFAETLGIQRSSISHLLSGRNKPSLDVLEKILIHFPRVNAEWLITGKHKAEKNNIRPTETKENKMPTTQNLQNENNLKSESGKRVVSIVKFYSDGTFQSFSPGN